MAQGRSGVAVMGGGKCACGEGKKREMLRRADGKLVCNVCWRPVGD